MWSVHHSRNISRWLTTVRLSFTITFLASSTPRYLNPYRSVELTTIETGGLFRLIARLMVACSPSACNKDLLDLSTLFGRLFQIRDDYQNLTSADVRLPLSHPSTCPTNQVRIAQYTKQKGFCEDLDEGKYSLPLVHALGADPQNMQLRSVLVQRRVAGQSTTAHKTFILEHLARTKSLVFTAEVLKTLHAETVRKIERLEKGFQIENFPLRLLLSMLSV